MSECPRCGACLETYQHNNGSRKYPDWQEVTESHSLEQCIESLRMRLDRLESKLEPATGWAHPDK